MAKARHVGRRSLSATPRETYNQMVKYFCSLLIAVLLGGSVACNRGIDTTEAVRQAVIDHLGKRSNLNVSAMNVEVTSVSFRQNEADATVAFTAKGAASGPPMTMRYTLERKGTRWVVKEKSETGNPHGVGATAPPANLPPGHPVFPIPKK